MRSGTVAPEPLHHHGPVFDVQRRAASCGPDNLLPVPALGPRAPSGTVLVRLRYDCFAEFRRRRSDRAGRTGAGDRIRNCDRRLRHDRRERFGDDRMVRIGRDRRHFGIEAARLEIGEEEVPAERL